MNRIPLAALAALSLAACGTTTITQTQPKQPQRMSATRIVAVLGPADTAKFCAAVKQAKTLSLDPQFFEPSFAHGYDGVVASESSSIKAEMPTAQAAFDALRSTC